MKRYESVVLEVEQSVRSGAFPVGSRLPSERHLASRFNVSRVTVRQALIYLQGKGRIQIKPGSGAYVLPSVARTDRYPNISALELTESRLLFESEAAALAAPVIDEDSLCSLEISIAEMSKEHSEDSNASDLADQKFHLTIAQATGNAAIFYIVEDLWRMRIEVDEIKRVYDSVCLEDASARGEEHQEILDALRTRKSDNARQAMKRHFKRLLESMLDITERDALLDVRKQVNESRERFLMAANL